MFLSYDVKRIATLGVVLIFAMRTGSLSAETNVQQTVKLYAGSSLDVDVAYAKSIVVCEAVVDEPGGDSPGAPDMIDIDGMTIKIIANIKGARSGTIPVNLSIKTWPPENPAENSPLKGEKVIMFVGDRERSASNRVVKVMAHTPENLKAVQAIKDREKKRTKQ